MALATSHFFLSRRRGSAPFRHPLEIGAAKNRTQPKNRELFDFFLLLFFVLLFFSLQLGHQCTRNVDGETRRRVKEERARAAIINRDVDVHLEETPSFFILFRDSQNSPN
ncbi:hypothetical protein GHT06_008670 [Daphnia sinensis]|uniref:Transmembrane protein n=1 Tax=Daphnia sinensis TaxID=1820382 RepID=A0AAD5Q2H0_9CRUS|nr:hypothetical protein GHT06_008670 [Daphnia sinensis]